MGLLSYEDDIGTLSILCELVFHAQYGQSMLIAASSSRLLHRGQVSTSCLCCLVTTTVSCFFCVRSDLFRNWERSVDCLSLTVYLTLFSLCLNLHHIVTLATLKQLIGRTAHHVES